MPRLTVGIKDFNRGHRHKVIGFVDAATRRPERPAGTTSRHKVIGFVDAATTMLVQL